MPPSPRLVLRLAVALRPPPASGADWKHRLQLYVFRFGCLLCAVVVPAFGVLYRIVEPLEADPLWARGLIALATLGLFVATLRSAWVRRHAEALFFVSCYAVTAWYAGVTYASGFSGNYTAGFFAVFVAGTMLISLGFDRTGPLVAYIVGTIALAVALLTVAEAPAVDREVLTASLLMAAGLVHVAVGTRLQMLKALEEREAQAERALSQAEAARREAEHARAEAEAARAQAEEMARLKSAFLANMSHEIRTPLTAIIGFAQVLAEEVPPDQQALVAPIEHGGRRLLDTLNSVLDLARLQAGRFDLRLEPVDAAEEAHALGDLLRPLAQRKGLALVVHAPPNGLVAVADRSALQRVLTNLVSNAVKFTDGGRVTLSAEGGAGGVRVRVRDTGRGIGASFLPKLFEEFRQESDGLARSHEGSGLGLAITRQLVELMGGSIAVESALGVGSVFTVALPASAGTPARGDGALVLPALSPCPAWAGVHTLLPAPQV